MTRRIQPPSPCPGDAAILLPHGRTDGSERVAALLWSSSSPGPAELAAVGKQTGWLPALACKS